MKCAICLFYEPDPFVFYELFNKRRVGLIKMRADYTSYDLTLMFDKLGVSREAVRRPRNREGDVLVLIEHLPKCDIKLLGGRY